MIIQSEENDYAQEQEMNVQVEGKRKFFRLLDSKEKEINRLKKKIVDLQELLDERTRRVVTLNQEIERLQTIITDRNHQSNALVQKEFMRLLEELDESIDDLPDYCTPLELLAQIYTRLITPIVLGARRGILTTTRKDEEHSNSVFGGLIFTAEILEISQSEVLAIMEQIPKDEMDFRGLIGLALAQTI